MVVLVVEPVKFGSTVARWVVEPEKLGSTVVRVVEPV